MHPALPITLAIIHAQEMVRQGIKLTFEAAGLAKVVLELAHPGALLSQWPKEGVQVVLLHLGNPAQEALDTVATLRLRCAGTAVLVMGDLTEGTACRAVAAGATGLLHCEALCAEVQQAIEVGAKGGIHNNAWFMHGMRGKRGAKAIPEPDVQPSERQLEVLRLLCRPEYLTRAAIAKKLGIGKRTVDEHIKALFKKYKVKSRHALLKEANRLGLL